MARQRLMTLHLGDGAYLSCTPPLFYKWRLSVFIVQRVTRQLADGGLPWPWWTSRASFRNRHSLTRWLTAARAGFTTISLLRYFAACMLLFLSVRFYHIAQRCLSHRRKHGSVVGWMWKWLEKRRTCLLHFGTQILPSHWVCFNKKWCLDVLVWLWQTVIFAVGRGYTSAI